ncbi:MAG: hypothetical protein Q9166_001142 [cf. Caloplaca sp. 2 TL-2023]
MSYPLITVIGSLNADLISRTSRIPVPGETLTSKSFSTGSGGKGANQAVACGRLSRSKATPRSTRGEVRVSMIGCVGNDSYGDLLIDNLLDSGVNTKDVHKIAGNEKTTGTAIIIVEEDTGENRILINPGVNALMKPGLFTSFGPNTSLGTYLPTLIVLQLEIPVDTVVQVIRDARERGVDVLLNPAPAVELPKEIYQNLAHLIMNETEAATLSKSMADETPNPNHQDLCERFHGLGVRNVIITLGSKGVYYSYRVPEGGRGEGGHIPAAKVEKVVDTTAAGDTFVGAYAVAAAKGASVVGAVEWANKCAAKTVEREGAQDAIPWLDEVEPMPESVESSRFRR